MLEKAYNAQKFEKDIYALWEKEGVFKPENNPHPNPSPKGRGAKEENDSLTHINILPPPNANGSLHLGHASGYTIMDIAGRYARMQGKETLLLPGKDHAGIMTQVIYERELRESGKDPKTMNRNELYQGCYDFCTESAATMRAQEKRIGLSADWDREKFTLDPKISEEVLETFMRMYKEGLAYRGNRIINWCPFCQTALSDMEVEKKDTEGEIWELKYPVIGENDVHIIVATTRPETMLGDSAVAVHPDDERYKHLIGEKILLPIVNREISIVADSEVDKEFGTGAVKVTPAHDALDYAIGKRHGLAEIQVVGLDGKMTSECPEKFPGLSTSEARKKVVEKLKEMGLLGKVKKHVKPLSKHDRCGRVIEPLISDQWWIHTDHPKFSLKKEAIKAVKEGKIEIVPKHFEKTFFHWMENLEDWCISRQLWWGHQIPAYYCEDCKEMEVNTSVVQECSKCGSKNIKQDTDTFDTWFSSGQWAHNTVYAFGEEQYFPGDLMVMGRDILFFWACRMIMMSLYSKKEIPFKTLYLTGLINDRHGKKMSKSKGNGIDPLEMADKYGTDALRLSLFIGSTPGNDMRLYEEKIEGYRNFVNKLWNAARFVQMQVESSSLTPTPLPEEEGTKRKSPLSPRERGLGGEGSETDKWILSRTNNLIKDVTEGLNNYRYSEAGQKLYDFSWNEFCDWYLELSKGEKQNPEVLLTVLSTLLKLLHPFIPFVTEVLWKELFASPHPNPSSRGRGAQIKSPLSLGERGLGGEGKLLALEPWPQYDPAMNFKESEGNIEFLKKVISEIRSTRAEAKVNVTKKIDARVLSKGNEAGIIERYSEEIMKMGSLQSLNKLEDGNEALPSNVIQATVSQKTTIYLIEEVDPEEEQKRIVKELEEAKKQLENLEKRLSNKGYVEKAPAHLIEQSRKEKVELEEKVRKLEG